MLGLLVILSWVDKSCICGELLGFPFASNRPTLDRTRFDKLSTRFGARLGDFDEQEVN